MRLFLLLTSVSSRIVETMNRAADQIHEMTKGIRLKFGKNFPNFALHFSTGWGDKTMAKAAIDSGASINGRSIANAFLNIMAVSLMFGVIGAHVTNYIVTGIFEGIFHPLMYPLMGTTILINAIAKFQTTPLNKALNDADDNPSMVKLLLDNVC